MYKEGDTIVNLDIETIDGKKIEIGKNQWIVLYFYPKDDTPGCTIQAKTFSELYDEFKNLNVEVIGISRDNSNNHQKFIQKHNLKINLVSDKDNKIASLFGVEGKLFFSRDTILIDPNGKVAKIWRKVSPSKNPHEIIEFIKKYNSERKI